MNTPVVASSTTTGWLTVACPWCGTINNIGLFGVQTLPGCGHVLDVQRPVGAGRPENEGRQPTVRDPRRPWEER
jgi:hypothetical protein